MLITVSNLFPRPDQPTRGMYNFQLFREMGKFLLVKGYQLSLPDNASGDGLLNICLVPEWRIWRWRSIRCWKAPVESETSQRESREDVLTPTIYLPAFYIPFLGRSINWWFCSTALKREAAFSHGKSTIYNQQSTIYYVPWLFPDGVAVARAIRGCGARLWLMVLGSDSFHLKSPTRRRRILEACEQAEGIVCVAQALADRLAAVGVSRDKLHVVPNGVDVSLFRIRETEELLINGDQLSVKSAKTNNRLAAGGFGRLTAGGTVLFVGNLVPVKGPDILLKAFARVVNGYRESGTKEPPPQLLIIGSGPMRRQLERLAHQLGVSERVNFMGNRSHDEVARWMNLVDVLCLTSRSEGMPNVVVEALSSGLPVVATAVGACPELLAGEPAARVCPSEDAVALAEALKSVLDQKVDREALAVRHAQHHSWRRQAESLMGLMASTDSR